MKKGSIVWLIISLITLIIVVYFLQNSNYDNDEWKGAEVWDLDYTTEYLDECYAGLDKPQKELSEDQIWCSDTNKIPSKEGINKLKLLDGTKILEICNINKIESPPYICSLSNDVSESCQNIWEISYQRIGVRPMKYVISINRCGKDYYLLSSSEFVEGGAKTDKISKIQLDEETINKLKEH